MKIKNIKILNEHIVNKVKFLGTKHKTINDKDKDLTLKVEKLRNDMTNTNEIFNFRSKIIKKYLVKKNLYVINMTYNILARLAFPQVGK